METKFHFGYFLHIVVSNRKSFCDWERQCVKSTQNGTLFPIGHDFYTGIPEKEAEIWLDTTKIQIRKINSD